MRLSKLRRILKNYPNLIDPYCKLSEKDAKEYLKDQEIPSFEQIWEGAKQKTNMPAKSWPTLHPTELRENREYKQKRCTLKENRLTLNWRRRLRGIVLAAGVVIILFFSLTETGRAFTKAFTNTLARIIGNVLYIRNGQDAKQIDVPDEPKTEIIESFGEVVKKIGKLPIVLMNEKTHLESATLEIMGMQTFVVSTYTFEEGKSIILRQMWSEDIEQMRDVSVGLENAEYFKGVILGNTVLEGAIHNDGSFSSVAMLSDSILYVLSEDAKNTLLIIKDLQVYNR